MALGRYVIMPDHVRLFVRGDPNFVLGNWVKGLKRTISNRFAIPSHAPFWQPGFFDHLLRSDENYAQKWELMFAKVQLRAGLVNSQKSGRIKARLFASTGLSDGVEARVLTRSLGQNCRRGQPPRHLSRRRHVATTCATCER